MKKEKPKPRDQLNIDPTDPKYAGHMVTATGQLINLLDPDPDKINLMDIAVGLGNANRWAGQTIIPYSVAEHSIRVCEKAPDRLKSAALFHDCEEAYWGDFIGPVKLLLKERCPTFLEEMKIIKRAIFQKFGIPGFGDPEVMAAIKAIDRAELLWEFETILKGKNHIPLSGQSAAAQWMGWAQWLTSK